MPYALIALNLGVFTNYTYGIPPELGETLQIGSYVAVPFGRENRVQFGFCIGFTETAVKGMKAIAKLMIDVPLFNERFLALCTWISTYYECPLGEVLAGAVPAGVRKRKATRLPLSYSLVQDDFAGLGGARKQIAVVKYLQAAGRPVAQDTLCAQVPCSAAVLKILAGKGYIAAKVIHADIGMAELTGTEAVELTGEQQTALTSITALIDNGGFRTVLLRGVTGSGKTELYIRAIERVVARGCSAIMLVPEIMLTPQMSARFSVRFSRVAVVHSRLSDGERAALWKDIAAGGFDVVIGPRSALFAPLPALGLIIVDEEHEHTFKQESAPRYHARDCAVYMGHHFGIPVILGSATPSMESLRNAELKRYDCAMLTKRVGGYAMPTVAVVNLADEYREKKIFSPVSLPLRLRLEETLTRGEQAIVFLNQRGFARFVMCPLCGKPLKCRNCDITLTYHKQREAYVCHYCNYSRSATERCPTCGFVGLARKGAGTQKLEEELQRLLPGAVIQRVDSDSMTTKSGYRDVLGRFARNEINILVGTQIVAKGLDFPNVTTVGIIGIENILNLPDFRAPERTFQMIAQVAGRAGRGDKKGQVMVEVFNASHYAIECAMQHDHARFYAIETGIRRELSYPPFGSLVRIVIEGPDRGRAERHAVELKERLAGQSFPRRVIILGPAEAPLHYINRRFRFHIMLKIPDRIPAGGLFTDHSLFANRGGVRVSVDIDPVSML